ncbi:hypothetical protein Syun_017822 [Stephania yunnanensis]|uniref:Uncharacterized protein n=1 Tax=Stephania yunnanensis TaxID=152371 RepID=A0AAP0P5H6_9MAGN
MVKLKLHENENPSALSSVPTPMSSPQNTSQSQVFVHATTQQEQQQRHNNSTTSITTVKKMKIKKKKKKQLFINSFRLHYNWCSSHVLPMPDSVVGEGLELLLITMTTMTLHGMQLSLLKNSIKGWSHSYQGTCTGSKRRAPRIAVVPIKEMSTTRSISSPRSSSRAATRSLDWRNKSLIGDTKKCWLEACDVHHGLVL